MWHRVFGLSPAAVSPSLLIEHLHSQGLVVEPHFKGDDHGWTQGALHLPGDGSPVLVDRYLTKVDDIRDDLNSFAALLETMSYSPANVSLMERVITTQQMFAFRKPIDHANESQLDSLMQSVCQYLAKATEGVYQIDDAGWFDAEGRMLLQEY
jgi:hypothetical protein